MDSFREWLTWREALALNLPGMPASRQSWWRYSRAEPLFGSTAFRRHRERLPGKRGLREVEYHYLAFPLPAIVAYETRAGLYPERGDQGGARGGTGLLDTAEGGLVRAFLCKRMRAAPDLTASALRAECVSIFGEAIAAGRIAAGVQPLTAMPPLRTFQHFMAARRAAEGE